MSKSSKPPSTTQSKNGNGITDLDTFDASEYEFNISASLMSKILEDSIQDTVTKHCDTCACNKAQNKPFCYNESTYSVATQTFLSGEMKTSLCLSCNSEMKSLNSSMSIGSVSPHGIRIINERSPNHIILSPLYIMPQQDDIPQDVSVAPIDNSIKSSLSVKDDLVLSDKSIGFDSIVAPQPIPKGVINIEDLKHIRKSNGMSMEPTVHHKLCDRTRTPLSSHKGSILSVAQEDLLITKDLPAIVKDIKSKNEKCEDNASLRKNSQSSMGAISRTSSIAKSTVSNHKSSTAVGPGPRFCHLRLQAGSKNILLDNAEADVPPVLYRRQSKCNESSLFKELTDDVDNFAINKHESDLKDDIKFDNVVVESTLIDVHVDSNYKEPNSSLKNASINPVLLNVSSSPLQPLKTHNFSNSSENNNNKSQSAGSQHNTSEIDNLLRDFNADITNAQNNNNIPATDVLNTTTVTTPTDNHDVKIFNFDRYEQNKLTSQYSKPLRKIEMAQLHSLENTRISKDLPPQGNLPKLDKAPSAKPTLPPIVNVYPNLTQTHLKVNENKKAFTNEQSTSSLSSDDSAALLQKQQLLRVAEWVEKNLSQQNNYNDPLEEDVNFVNRAARRDSKLSRLTDTLNELALNMPHPVSKFSKSYSKEVQKSWIHNATQKLDNGMKQTSVSKIATNVVKETIFPVESGDATVTEISNDNGNSNVAAYQAARDFRDAFNGKSEKEITAEDLARMEYNVKKFLLSGPQWANPGSAGRSRRTSSKTETDV